MSSSLFVCGINYIKMLPNFTTFKFRVWGTSLSAVTDVSRVSCMSVAAGPRRVMQLLLPRLVQAVLAVSL